MSLTLEHIHRTINNLGRLMPAKPNKNSTRKYSLKESIFLMAPKLLEMKEMGFTSKELVKSLTHEGIEIKDATLNRYLCDYQKRNSEEPGGQTDKETVKGTAKEDAEPDDAKSENQSDKKAKPKIEQPKSVQPERLLAEKTESEIEQSEKEADDDFKTI